MKRVLAQSQVKIQLINGPRAARQQTAIFQLPTTMIIRKTHSPAMIQARLDHQAHFLNQHQHILHSINQHGHNLFFFFIIFIIISTVLHHSYCVNNNSSCVRGADKHFETRRSATWTSTTRASQAEISPSTKSLLKSRR